MSLDPRVDILATLFHDLRSPDGEPDGAGIFFRVVFGYCHAPKKVLDSTKTRLEPSILLFPAQTSIFDGNLRRFTLRLTDSGTENGVLERSNNSLGVFQNQ